MNIRSWLSNISHITRLLLGLTLLGFIISRIPLSDLTDVLRTLDTPYLFAAYALFLLTVALSTYRWHILHSIYQQGRPPFGQLLSVNFMGIFFNNVMPSSVGGDVFRVLRMSKTDAGYPGAFSTVLVDRIIGLSTLLLVGFFSIVFGHIHADIPTELAFWSALLIAGLCIVLVVTTNIRFHTLLLSLSSSFLTQRKHEWVHRKLTRFSTYLAVYSGERKLLIKALTVSIVFQIVWILGSYMTNIALHVGLPVYVFFAIMPLVELIRMVPVTIQGIGIREGAFVVLTARFGVSSSEATVLAVLIYVLLSLNGVLGGIIFVLTSFAAKDSWDFPFPASRTEKKGK